MFRPVLFSLAITVASAAHAEEYTIPPRDEMTYCQQMTELAKQCGSDKLAYARQLHVAAYKHGIGVEAIQATVYERGTDPDTFEPVLRPTLDRFLSLLEKPCD